MRRAVEDALDHDFVEEVMETIECGEAFGSREGEDVDEGGEVDVWGDGKREWMGWVEYRKSVERRCGRGKRVFDDVGSEYGDLSARKRVRT